MFIKGTVLKCNLYFNINLTCKFNINLTCKFNLRVIYLQLFKYL